MPQLKNVLGVVVLTLLAATAQAQTLPDFSGRWLAVAEPAPAGNVDPSAIPNTMGSGWGTEITITQDAAALVVERAQFSQYDMQPPMRLRYTLDGSASCNTINMGRGPQELVSTANPQGTSIAITTSYQFTERGGRAGTVEVKQVLSLEPAGSLVVTTTRTGPGGTPSATTTKTTYKKG
jgi:hypothetical protein